MILDRKRIREVTFDDFILKVSHLCESEVKTLLKIWEMQPVRITVLSSVLDTPQRTLRHRVSKMIRLELVQEFYDIHNLQKKRFVVHPSIRKFREKVV